jgi:hypothetical protein
MWLRRWAIGRVGRSGIVMADDVAGLGLQGILVVLSQRQPWFVIVVEEARGHHLLGAENSRCQPLVGWARPPLPLWVLDDLEDCGTERGAEGPPSRVGRPLSGSTQSLLPWCRQNGRGVSIIALTSFSVQVVIKARFAVEGSPSRSKVEMEPTNGTRALPAMVVQRV